MQPRWSYWLAVDATAGHQLYSAKINPLKRQEPTWRVSRATRLRAGSTGVKHTVTSSFILMGFPDMGHSTVLLFRRQKKKGGRGKRRCIVEDVLFGTDKNVCECLNTNVVHYSRVARCRLPFLSRLAFRKGQPALSNNEWVRMICVSGSRRKPEAWKYLAEYLEW